MKSLGWDCKEYDLVNREQEDLTNDFIWQQVKADIRAKKYDGLIAGPPCNTFTNVRKDDGLGPLPLRGPSGPDRCGLVHLAGEVGQSQNRNFAGTEIGRSCDGHGDRLVHGLRWGSDWPSRRLTEEIQCARMTVLDQQGQN